MSRPAEGSAEFLRSIADAVERGDDAACLTAAMMMGGFVSTEQAVVWAIDRLLRTARYDASRRDYRPALRRWVRRAAMNGQTWAMDRIGLEWARDSDPDHPHPHWPAEIPAGENSQRPDWWPDEWPAPDPEEIIDAQLAKRWLVAAARRGDRRAAYWAGIVDPANIDVLRIGYGSGVPDEEIDAFGRLLWRPELRARHRTSTLCAIATRLALAHHDRDDPDAGHWFRLAVECPRWEEEDTRLTWIQAVAAYAEWAHARNDAMCAVLCQVIADDAATRGPGDRIEIREEAHKPWRLDYGRAIESEAARARMLTHMITEHTRSDEHRLRLLRLLAHNAKFTHERHRELVLDVLTKHRGSPLNLAAIDAMAWELVQHLMTETLPTMLRAIRCEAEAHQIEEAAMWVDFSPSAHLFDEAVENTYIGNWDAYISAKSSPLQAAESAWSSYVSTVEQVVESVLTVCQGRIRGSGEDRARIRVAEDEDAQSLLAVAGLDVALDAVGDLRGPDTALLLQGSPAWLAMWLATSTPPPRGLVKAHNWAWVWVDVSRLTMRTALAVVRHQRGMVENQPDDLDRHPLGVTLGKVLKPGIQARTDRISNEVWTR